MSLLEIQPRPKVHEDEKAAMILCYNDYYKTVLGPLLVREDALHPRRCCEGTDREHDCAMFACHHQELPGVSTQAEKMWAWEDYVLNHYERPKIATNSLEKDLGFK